MQVIDSILKDLLPLAQAANEIVDSELSWERKYDLIFSEHISRKVFKLVNLDYYDPDTSYEEDVLAFVGALNSYIDELKND